MTTRCDILSRTKRFYDEKECVVCGKIFYVKKSAKMNYITCSTECSHANQHASHAMREYYKRKERSR